MLLEASYTRFYAHHITSLGKEMRYVQKNTCLCSCGHISCLNTRWGSVLQGCWRSSRDVFLRYPLLTVLPRETGLLKFLLLARRNRPLSHSDEPFVLKSETAAVVLVIVADHDCGVGEIFATPTPILSWENRLRLRHIKEYAILNTVILSPVSSFFPFSCFLMSAPAMTPVHGNVKCVFSWWCFP